MNGLSQDVLVQLRPEKAKAVTAGVLAQRFGFKDDRPIREAIRELIANGYPVAALVKRPFGYYLVTEIEDAQEYARSLKSRLVEDAYRLRDFRRAAKLRLANRQLSLM